MRASLWRLQQELNLHDSLRVGFDRLGAETWVGVGALRERRGGTGKSAAERTSHKVLSISKIDAFTSLAMKAEAFSGTRTRKLACRACSAGRKTIGSRPSEETA